MLLGRSSPVPHELFIIGLFFIVLHLDRTSRKLLTIGITRTYIAVDVATFRAIGFSISFQAPADYARYSAFCLLFTDAKIRVAAEATIYLSMISRRIKDRKGAGT